MTRMQVRYAAELTGPNHRTQALARRMVRRGEIRVDWSRASVTREGVARVPYIRLKPYEQVRRERLLRMAGYGVLGFTTLCVVLTALWEARIIIAGGTILAGSAWFTITRLRHASTCTGLHCPDCHR